MSKIISETAFNQFLQANKEKINTVVPKNPSITKTDEWRQEEKGSKSNVLSTQ